MFASSTGSLTATSTGFRPNPQAATDYDELRLRAIQIQRQALDRLRAEGRIGKATHGARKR
jgi:hypothetical protein